MDKITRSNWFEGAMVTSIALAGILVGVSTSRDSDYPAFLDDLVLGVFTAEICVKLIAEGERPTRYFFDGWNRFDFAIVMASYIPKMIRGVEIGPILVGLFRLLRILRTFKLVSKFRRMKIIAEAVLKGFSSIGYISLLMIVSFYMFAIGGMILFKQNDPWHFGLLQDAMITLFRCATLDDWTDIMYTNMWGCDRYGYHFHPEACVAPEAWGWVAAIYFMFFSVTGSMVLVTLFLGVVTTSMEQAALRVYMEDNLKDEVLEVQKKYDITDYGVKVLYNAFTLLDEDEGGTLEYEELLPLMSSISKDFSGFNFKSIFRCVDEDGSGSVDFVEFLRMMYLIKNWFEDHGMRPRSRVNSAVTTFVFEHAKKNILPYGRRGGVMHIMPAQRYNDDRLITSDGGMAALVKTISAQPAILEESCDEKYEEDGTVYFNMDKVLAENSPVAMDGQGIMIENIAETGDMGDDSDSEGCVLDQVIPLEASRERSHKDRRDSTASLKTINSLVTCTALDQDDVPAPEGAENLDRITSSSRLLPLKDEKSTPLQNTLYNGSVIDGKKEILCDRNSIGSITSIKSLITYSVMEGNDLEDNQDKAELVRDSSRSRLLPPKNGPQRVSLQNASLPQNDAKYAAAEGYPPKGVSSPRPLPSILDPVVVGTQSVSVPTKGRLSLSMSRGRRSVSIFRGKRSYEMMEQLRLLGEILKHLEDQNSLLKAEKLKAEEHKELSSLPTRIKVLTKQKTELIRRNFSKINIGETEESIDVLPFVDHLAKIAQDLSFHPYKKKKASSQYHALFNKLSKKSRKRILRNSLEVNTSIPQQSYFSFPPKSMSKSSLLSKQPSRASYREKSSNETSHSGSKRKHKVLPCAESIDSGASTASSLLEGKVEKQAFNELIPEEFTDLEKGQVKDMLCLPDNEDDSLLRPGLIFASRIAAKNGVSQSEAMHLLEERKSMQHDQVMHKDNGSDLGEGTHKSETPSSNQNRDAKAVHSEESLHDSTYLDLSMEAQSDKILLETDSRFLEDAKCDEDVAKQNPLHHKDDGKKESQHTEALLDLPDLDELMPDTRSFNKKSDERAGQAQGGSLNKNTVHLEETNTPPEQYSRNSISGKEASLPDVEFSDDKNW